MADFKRFTSGKDHSQCRTQGTIAESKQKNIKTNRHSKLAQHLAIDIWQCNNYITLHYIAYHLAEAFIIQP